jgi:hypothetical protein
VTADIDYRVTLAHQFEALLNLQQLVG